MHNMILATEVAQKIVERIKDDIISCEMIWGCDGECINCRHDLSVIVGDIAKIIQEWNIG